MELTDAAGYELWVGGHTADGGGTAEGIALIRGDGRGGLEWVGVAVEAPSPSFVATHPSLPVVYAVGEEAQTVRAYRRGGPATLEPLGEAWPAGGLACHVMVDPAGRFIVVACWGDGRIILYPLDEAGAITDRFEAAPATDPYASAERSSRGHAALTLPDGRLATTDLGFDLLRIWRYEPGVGLIADHDVTLPEGSGPRHLTLHRSGRVYVITEYSVEVVTVAPGIDGRYGVTRVVPAVRGGAEQGDTGAEISLSESGDRLHVGVRGSNRIATLVVGGDATSLEPLSAVPSGGDWPRHHFRHGSILHVANRRSHSVSAFRLDPESGEPVELLTTIDVPSPSCLALVTA